MAKRQRHRKHRPNPPPVELKHSPFTPAGYVEGWGRFARGAFRARGARGIAARVMVWWMLAGFALFVVWILFLLIRAVV
jgi:hypothetical protein